MDYKEQIEALKNLEAIAYGYNINGEVLGMDCSDFEQIMVDAAEAITDLLARAEAADILGDNYDLDRLRELVEADRDGRCVVLPCKVGDTVYLLNHHLGRIFENEVSNFLVGYASDNKNTINTVYIGKYGSITFRKWKFQQVGKTVFLTREAAEDALKASDVT